jgi:hypothetical protein
MIRSILMNPNGYGHMKLILMIIIMIKELYVVSLIKAIYIIQNNNQSKLKYFTNQMIYKI